MLQNKNSFANQFSEKAFPKSTLECEEPHIHKKVKLTQEDGASNRLCPLGSESTIPRSAATQQVRTKDDDSCFKYCMISKIRYEVSYSYEEGFIWVKITANNLPDILEPISHKESKNYLKIMGDYFLKELDQREILKSSKNMKDCLNSLPIWNCLFDSEKRSNFDTKNFMFVINELSEKEWLSAFLEFILGFDPKTFRNHDRIQKPETKLIYEMNTRILKEIVRLVILLKKSLCGREILHFELKRVHKSSGLFCFKTACSYFDKKFVFELQKPNSEYPEILDSNMRLSTSEPLGSFKSFENFELSEPEASTDDSLYSENQIDFLPDLFEKHKNSEDSMHQSTPGTDNVLDHKTTDSLLTRNFLERHEAQFYPLCFENEYQNWNLEDPIPQNSLFNKDNLFDFKIDIFRYSDF